MVRTVKKQVTKTIKPKENVGYSKDSKLKIEINIIEKSRKYIFPTILWYNIKDITNIKPNNTEVKNKPEFSFGKKSDTERK